MSTTLYDRTRTIADDIRSRIGDRQPRMLLVLGSGLGMFADQLEDRVVMPYGDIDGFPVSGVKGHAGNLVFGKLEGHDLLVMQGRIHFYESGDMGLVTLPIRILSHLGVETMFVTNSAGGLNPDFEAGNLMLITDHLNMMGTSPLFGHNDERFGPRFPDMTEAYNPVLRQHVIDAAADLNIELKQGIYSGFHGPEYETPATVRMAGVLGSDAVGMSTVPEVIVANHCGIRCVGISCISNLAAGISPTKLHHAEVVETANRVAQDFVGLVRASVLRILS